MLKNILQNKSLKYISFWLISAIFYLLFKYLLNLPGNLNLIFGIQLLLAQFFGPIALGLWSAVNILANDLLANNLGAWSLVTSFSYFLVSFLTKIFISTHKFKLIGHKNYSFINYLIFTVFVTLIYDLITASTGPLLFQQAWSNMLVGQIPFTLVHIISNYASTSLIYGFYFTLRVQLIPSWIEGKNKSSWKKLVSWLWFVSTKLGSKYVAK
jgi:hypothetical protein